MSGPATARLRRLWLNIHLWLGLGLALLLVPIGLTGSLLVWHDHVDVLINPARYATTSGPAAAPSTLLASATRALGGLQPVALRMPEGVGWPATVTARESRGANAGGRPRFMTVYLDPPTAKVLDVVETRSTLINFLHRFHENLTVPEYNGRSIVGWVGVAMLILSLSGIYLWWPRNAGFVKGLRWTRGPRLSLNLHHMLGFWISIPLAVVSFTGIYLGFPQQGRDLLSSVAPMSQRSGGGFNQQLARQTSLNIDAAVAAAVAAEPGRTPAAIFFPPQQNPAWRIQMRAGGSDDLSTVMVDDRSGAASKVTPLSGDRIALWIRWVHEGSNAGMLWRVLVFLCGVFPTIFAVTGFFIWLRRREGRNVTQGLKGVPQLDAASETAYR
ncbi:MAG: PepSY-associated TM helix domain-containing protein [Pseudomonadota bacterium]